ncbi:MAG: energy transducer TonB [Bryobacteraceae bacterium]
MEVANQSSPAPTLRRIPFAIRFAPQFVERLSALLRDDQQASAAVTGLVFGQLEADFILVQTFRPLASFEGPDETSNANRTVKDWRETMVARSKSDPELSALTLAGWLSVRNALGMQAEDVAFQEKNFRNPTDIALIVKNEDKGEFTLELWYGQNLDANPSAEGQPWGAIRLSGAEALRSPVELPIRSRVHDDLYMRAYEFLDAQDGSSPGWKQALSKTKKVLEGFKPGKLMDKSSGEALSHALDEHVNKPSAIYSFHSVNQTAQAGSAGTAAAPARTPQQPEVPNPEEQVARTQPEDNNVCLGSETPASIIPEKQRPPAAHLEDVVLVRSEERSVSGQPKSGATPASVPPDPVYREPKPVVAPATVNRPEVAGELTRYPSKRVRELPWRAMVAVFALAAGATFGFIYIKSAGANGKLPGFLQVFWPSPALDLKVSSSGDRFQLSWNRSSSVVQNAREATLDIKDGLNHRQISLGGAELAHGSVLYFPSTDNVVFRLDVRGAAGQYLSESLRVMGTTQSPTLQVSRPADVPSESLTASARQSAMGDTHTVKKSIVESFRRASPARRTERLPGQRLSAKDAVQTQTTDQLAFARPDSQTQLPTASTSDKPAVERRNAEAASASTGAGATENSSQPNPSPQKEAVRPPLENVPTTSTPQAPKRDDVAQALPRAGQNPSGSEGMIGNAASPQPASAPAQAGATQSRDLVSFRPPRPIKQVLPKLNMLPPGTAEPGGELKVAVRVDESGRVVSARLVEGRKKVSSLLAAAAISAAKQWVFEPASLHGRDVASDHTILFQFRR